MNCITICGGKRLSIVTLKVLPTSCSCSNSEEKGQNSRFLKWSQTELIQVSLASSSTKCFEDFEKMTGF